MRKALCAAALLVLQACASLPGDVVQVEEEDSTRTLELKTGQVLDIARLLRQLRIMAFSRRAARSCNRADGLPAAVGEHRRAVPLGQLRRRGDTINVP